MPHTITAAAKILGLSRQRLYVLLRDYGIDAREGLTDADLDRLRQRNRRAGPPKGSQNARRYPPRA